MKWFISMVNVDNIKNDFSFFIDLVILFLFTRIFLAKKIPHNNIPITDSTTTLAPAQPPSIVDRWRRVRPLLCPFGVSCRVAKAAAAAPAASIDSAVWATARSLATTTAASSFPCRSCVERCGACVCVCACVSGRFFGGRRRRQRPASRVGWKKSRRGAREEMMWRGRRSLLVICLVLTYYYVHLGGDMHEMGTVTRRRWVGCAQRFFGFYFSILDWMQCEGLLEKTRAFVFVLLCWFLGERNL